MRTMIHKWGNSLALRIPSALAAHSGVQEGSVVTLESKPGVITLKTVKNKQSLRALISAIKSSNIHEETRAGSSIGKEIW